MSHETGSMSCLPVTALTTTAYDVMFHLGRHWSLQAAHSHSIQHNNPTANSHWLNTTDLITPQCTQTAALIDQTGAAAVSQ